MIRPENQQPDNVVVFKVSMEMTKFDVENYLREIYKVPVVEVRTRIALGEFYQDTFKKYVKKKEDDKIAYVTLVWQRLWPHVWIYRSFLVDDLLSNSQPKDVKFTFPDLFSEETRKEEEDQTKEALDSMKEKFKTYVDRNKNRPGLPGWFSI